MLNARLRLLIAALWVGSIWTIGFVVAPTLFAMLADRNAAGAIAGGLFRIEAWLSLGCGLLLLLLHRMARGQGTADPWSSRLIIGMLLCTLVGYFVLQPFMAELRTAVGVDGVMTQEARARFEVLHGVSSALYLMQSLLGGALLWKFAAFRQAAAVVDRTSRTECSG